MQKAAATLLLILIASPFTAPFETCDVLTLFGHTTTTQYQYQTPLASVEDQSQAITVTSASRRVRSRHKNPAPASAVLAIEFAEIGRTARVLPTAAFATHVPVLTSRTPLRI
jgi:hypothetical protein